MPSVLREEIHSRCFNMRLVLRPEFKQEKEKPPICLLFHRSRGRINRNLPSQIRTFVAGEDAYQGRSGGKKTEKEKNGRHRHR
jgi:hypothetical protein